jgi:hypothetical protein
MARRKSRKSPLKSASEIPIEPEIGVWRVNQPQKIKETTEKLGDDER